MNLPLRYILRRNRESSRISVYTSPGVPGAATRIRTSLRPAGSFSGWNVTPPWEQTICASAGISTVMRKLFSSCAESSPRSRVRGIDASPSSAPNPLTVPSTSIFRTAVGNPEFMAFSVMSPSVISTRSPSRVTPGDCTSITVPCRAHTVVLFPRSVMGLPITTGPSNSPGGSAAVPPSGVAEIISYMLAKSLPPPDLFLFYQTFTP